MQSQSIYFDGFNVQPFYLLSPLLTDQLPETYEHYTDYSKSSYYRRR